MWRPDGVEVSIAEFNAAQEKDAPVTRPAPPLTLAELTAMASSAQWTASVPAATAEAQAGLFTPDYTWDRPDGSGGATGPAATMPPSCALLAKAGKLVQADRCAAKAAAQSVLRSARAAATASR